MLRLEVSTVLTIYGVIIMSSHGVFPYSSNNTDTANCTADMSKYGPSHGPSPYVISFNVSESSSPRNLIKLYNLARRFPNINYLLYRKGDILKKWRNLVRPINFVPGRKKLQVRLRYIRPSMTLLKYVHLFRIIGHTICFAVHGDNYSPGDNYLPGRLFSYVGIFDRLRYYSAIQRHFDKLFSSYYFDTYAHASPNELPDVVAAYNGTELSFINETCSDDDDVLFPTLPPATTTVNVIYTKCTIDLLGRGLREFLLKIDYYENTLSKISAMNLTGSEKTVSKFLERLNTGEPIYSSKKRQKSRIIKLVSLDISHSTLYAEDSLTCKENDKDVNTTLPVIKMLFARNVFQEYCTFYIQTYNYMSCIVVRHFKCCRQRTVICIKPETLELLNIADNNIEHIDISLTNALTRLKVLDISGNHLHSRNGGANINLGRMTGLTEFYCSNNKLKTLSAGIFNAMFNLTTVDLSFNKLTSITFRLQHLRQLRLLNLFKNEIKLSESLLRVDLTNLFMTHSDNTVEINLVENPLICSMTCKTKAVLTWLLEHETEMRFSPLSCELAHTSRIRLINKSTLNAVEELCRGPLYTAIACVLGAITAAVVIITALAVYRHRLSLRRERRILNRIRNFKEDTYRERYPVFLSFCSSNTDFVMENVFEELNRRIKELLGTNRRCVAFGDADFRPGALVVEEMIHCISRCDVVIVCVSNDFLRSLWCTDEVHITRFLRKPIILMFLEQADKKLLAKSILQRYFSMACRAKWAGVNGILELQPDWNVLCESVVSRMVEHEAEPDEVETYV